MDDLEAKWEQNWSYDDSAGGDSCRDMDVDENSHSNQNQNQNQQNAETVHMQLFYDSKENNVPVETAHPSNVSEFAD